MYPPVPSTSFIVPIDGIQSRLTALLPDLSSTFLIDRIWRVLYLPRVALRPNDIAGISPVIAQYSFTHLPMLKNYFANISKAPMPRRMTKGPLDVEEYVALAFQRNSY